MAGRTAPIAASVAIYMPTATSPGMMPAMNSLPMSCSVMIPYTTSTVEGGNIAPSVPPAAIVPAATDCG